MFGVSAIEAYIITNGIILLLFISICAYQQSFYKIFESAVNQLDRCRRADEIIVDLTRFRILTQKLVDQKFKLNYSIDVIHDVFVLCL